jgi:hypothetical protein
VLACFRELLEYERMTRSARSPCSTGLVFVPASTWIRLKNTGTETINLVVIFSPPGFEDFLRCRSVPSTEKVTSISAEEIKECAHQGHVVAFEETPKN